MEKAIQALLPHFIVAGIFFISMIIFAAGAIKTPFKTPENVNPNTSKLIPKFFVDWTMWSLGHFVNVFIKIGLTPNVITAISVLFGLAGGLCFAAGHFGAAGWMIIGAGAFDMMDGWVARQTGKTSKAGGFIDSCMDRYVEMALFIGLIYYYRQTGFMVVFAALALSGGMMVSYARARGESMGVLYKKGLMQRAERLFYLAIVATFTPFLQLFIAPNEPRPFYWPTAIVVILIGALAPIGSVQRVIGIAKMINKAA